MKAAGADPVCGGRTGGDGLVFRELIACGGIDVVQRIDPLWRFHSGTQNCVGSRARRVDVCPHAALTLGGEPASTRCCRARLPRIQRLRKPMLREIIRNPGRWTPTVSFQCRRAGIGYGWMRGGAALPNLQDMNAPTYAHVGSDCWMNGLFD